MEFRKQRSKSINTKKTSRMKRLVTEFTEVKRPADKQKPSRETGTYSKTLPKNFQISNPATKTDSVLINAKRLQRVKSEKCCNQEETPCQSETKTLKTLDKLHEENSNIVKKLEKFRSSFKHKTSEHDNKKIKENCSNSEEIAQSSTNNEHDEETVCKHHDDDGVMSDDSFGCNSFEDDSEDNYILETYNNEGEYLIKTSLEITRQTINTNTIDYTDEYLHNCIKESDFVVQIKEASISSDNEENNQVKEIRSTDIEPEENVYVNGAVTSEVDSSDIKTSSKESLNNFQEVINNQNKEENTLQYEYVDNYSSVNPLTQPAYEKIPIPKKKEKIMYQIEEMKETEELYIHGLRKIVKSYLPYLYEKTSKDMVEQARLIFGNIEEIYENAKVFLSLLKLYGTNADSLADIFIHSEPEFQLYTLYSKNKPTADIYYKQFEEIIRDHQNKIGDRLGLGSYLLTPIQRLGKYVLLLEGIQNELRKSGKPIKKISAAINVVRNVMKKGNDFIAIDSIKNCDIDLLEKGSFIMRSLFTIVKPRKFLSMVFLFEQIVVFTEIDKSNKILENFTYLDSISMTDLRLGKCENKSTIFELTNYTKLKNNSLNATFMLETDSPKVKHEWTETIEDILWKQLVIVKETQGKINEKNQKTAKAKTRPSSKTNSEIQRISSQIKTKSKFYDASHT